MASRVCSRVERRQRAEFVAIGRMVRDYRRRGYSSEMCLDHAALSADKIQIELRHRGIRASTNTIRADLEPYRVAPLAKAAPGAEPYKRALTYNVLRMCAKFGRLGHLLLGDLFFSGSDVSLSSSSHPRVRGLLKWAIENVRDGVRNETGRWLASRCTELGLPEDEVVTVMREFWVHANSIPSRHAYGWGEVQATVRHAYRRLGLRLAPVQLPTSTPTVGF